MTGQEIFNVVGGALLTLLGAGTSTPSNKSTYSTWNILQLTI